MEDFLHRCFVLAPKFYYLVIIFFLKIVISVGTEKHVVI